eukprot:gene8042-8237_t
MPAIPGEVRALCQALQSARSPEQWGAYNSALCHLHDQVEQLFQPSYVKYTMAAADMLLRDKEAIQDFFGALRQATIGTFPSAAAHPTSVEAANVQVAVMLLDVWMTGVYNDAEPPFSPDWSPTLLPAMASFLNCVGTGHHKANPIEMMWDNLGLQMMSRIAAIHSCNSKDIPQYPVGVEFELWVASVAHSCAESGQSQASSLHFALLTGLAFVAENQHGKQGGRAALATAQPVTSTRDESVQDEGSSSSRSQSATDAVKLDKAGGGRSLRVPPFHAQLLAGLPANCHKNGLQAKLLAAHQRALDAADPPSAWSYAAKLLQEALRLSPVILHLSSTAGSSSSSAATDSKRPKDAEDDGDVLLVYAEFCQTLLSHTSCDDAKQVAPAMAKRFQFTGRILQALLRMGSIKDPSACLQLFCFVEEVCIATAKAAAAAELPKHDIATMTQLLVSLMKKAAGPSQKLQDAAWIARLLIGHITRECAGLHKAQVPRRQLELWPVEGFTMMKTVGDRLRGQAANGYIGVSQQSIEWMARNHGLHWRAIL